MAVCTACIPKANFTAENSQNNNVSTTSGREKAESSTPLCDARIFNDSEIVRANIAHKKYMLVSRETLILMAGSIETYYLSFIYSFSRI